jgi:ABC-type multidrug transport system fused ATPase/permease subunit
VKIGKGMETVIIVAILLLILIMIVSIKVAKQFSKLVFIVIFLGVSATLIILQGLTQQSLENIAGIGFGLLIGWLRLNDSFNIRSQSPTWLESKLSQGKYSKCEICGKELSYHSRPKNLRQILFGGLTCENCGEEYDIPFDVFLSSQ